MLCPPAVRSSASMYLSKCRTSNCTAMIPVLLPERRYSEIEPPYMLNTPQMCKNLRSLQRPHSTTNPYTRIGSNKGKTPEHNQAEHTKHPTARLLLWYIRIRVLALLHAVWKRHPSGCQLKCQPIRLQCQPTGDGTKRTAYNYQYEVKRVQLVQQSGHQGTLSTTRTRAVEGSSHSPHPPPVITISLKFLLCNPRKFDLRIQIFLNLQATHW